MASRSKWARIEALLRNRAFVADYLSARGRWRQGEPTLFPPGTEAVDDWRAAAAELGTAGDTRTPSNLALGGSIP
jgi:hypothetical protein